MVSVCKKGVLLWLQNLSLLHVYKVYILSEISKLEKSVTIRNIIFKSLDITAL